MFKMYKWSTICVHSTHGFIFHPNEQYKAIKRKGLNTFHNKESDFWEQAFSYTTDLQYPLILMEDMKNFKLHILIFLLLLKSFDLWNIFVQIKIIAIYF